VFGNWCLEIVTIWTLILRSLRFHARAHLGTLLGAAIGSAVLIGALAVGDSVRASLREMALARLGKVRLALAANDRFFRAALADDLQGLTGGTVVAAMTLPATINTPDGSARANRVQAVGVNDRFWLLSEGRPSFKAPSPTQVVLNASLAEQLKVKAGDNVVLRVARPDPLSRETPIAPQEGSSISLRLEVSAIASDADFGRFSLQASQIAPFNAFVSLAALQEQLKLPGGANLLLVNAAEEATSASRADDALRQAWQLADAGLELRELREANALELRANRVFLDPPIVEAALKAATNAIGVLTYFVNELRVDGRATPYSMVTAMGAPVVPAGMGDDEILVNQWVAEDLQAGRGDQLSLSYYGIGLSRRLEERTNRFTVRAVVPLSGYAADRTLMPDFPGLDKAESTRDWDASLPVKLDRIRPRDEAYWKAYRGTPKAFITLAAGQKLWANRFGDLTAVRYPTGAHLFSGGMRSREVMDLPPRAAADPKEKQTPEPIPQAPMADEFKQLRPKIERALLSQIEPASIGLRFEPVRTQALVAAEQAQDFGGLFLGFSFFLVAAALLLMALLFQFGIERRATEVGTLLALGFTPKQVRRLLLLEGGALALAGGIIGGAGGIGYARAMLLGLSTIWREAVQTSALRYHAEPQTLVAGTVAAVLVAWLTIWLALRRQAHQPARELLAEGMVEKFQAPGSSLRRGARARNVAAVTGLSAAALVGWSAWRRDFGDSETFFSAGALLLIAGVSACSALLSALSRPRAGAKLTLSAMGARNCARRRTRSLATLGLLGCGSFLIASIGVFRLEAVRDAEKRASGTGGFALIGETTLPVVQDLNSKAGREFFGLDDKALAGVAFVPFRVRDGDDASCLNLNRPQKPRLLGVNPPLLADRRAFRFAKVAKDLPKENPWQLLKDSAGEPAPDPSRKANRKRAGESQAAPPKNASMQSSAADQEIVPVIGDEASIVWAMGKKVGDTLDYIDERGRNFKLRIVATVANSILQGNLVIAEDEFIKRFPSETGYRMFLVDAPEREATEITKDLSRALRDMGMELTPTVQRLSAFNAVQNTYLSTFQILGGLGLLLGTAGLGVVVMRNVLERRGELGLLLAVGFEPRALKWLVMSEHGALLLIGLGVGILAALVAVLPALLSPGVVVPYFSLSLTLAAVLVSGAAWTWLATALALRGELLKALRNE
jgi:putative ABC transport system permease protein